jgi:hypothetical protein
VPGHTRRRGAAALLHDGLICERRAWVVPLPDPM